MLARHGWSWPAINYNWIYGCSPSSISPAFIFPYIMYGINEACDITLPSPR